jgi:hypothetical protein
MRLIAALPVLALFSVPDTAKAAPVTFQARLVYSIVTPGGNRQANTALVQVELRKAAGKWALAMQAAEYDASSYKVGKVNASCVVTSSDRDEIVTAYKLVMESLNKPGIDVVCAGTVSAPAANAVDLQQPAQSFSIMDHA